MSEAPRATGRHTLADTEFTAIAFDLTGVPAFAMSPDGRIEAFNHRCEEITGYQADEVLGRHVWDVLVPQEDGEAIQRVIVDCLEADGDHRFLCQWITRFGARLHIAWICRSVAAEDGARMIVAVGTDVTGHAEKQAESRERSALLQSVINTSPEAIVVIDDRGIIRDFSPTGEKMLGYAAREVIGRNVSVLMPSPHRELHDGYMSRYFETGEKRIIGKVRELVAQRKDGSIFPIELMVDEVFVNDMRLFTGFIRDISLRKATENELRKLNAELMHAGRVAVMGEMASAIAHEINQPLTAIANYIAACRRMLERPAPNIDSVRDIAAKAEAQVERARDIVRHFRSFVRKGQPERHSTDLNVLVNDALALALVDARENGIITEIRLTPAIPPILADGVQIQQVVLNLVRNAVDALHETRDRRLLVATSWQTEDAMAEFAVHDSGPGIAPEIKEKLFQPFMTTKAQGMGIGLSLCRSIISAHEGRLWAESNEWGGTSFRFALPLSTE